MLQCPQWLVLLENFIQVFYIPKSESVSTNEGRSSARMAFVGKSIRVDG
jgi:hypothetical protein